MKGKAAPTNSVDSVVPTFTCKEKTLYLAPGLLEGRDPRTVRKGVFCLKELQMRTKSLCDCYSFRSYLE
jgi:hypothetical protein